MIIRCWVSSESVGVHCPSCGRTNPVPYTWPWYAEFPIYCFFCGINMKQNWDENAIEVRQVSSCSNCKAFLVESKAPQGADVPILEVPALPLERCPRCGCRKMSLGTILYNNSRYYYPWSTKERNVLSPWFSSLKAHDKPVVRFEVSQPVVCSGCGFFHEHFQPDHAYCCYCGRNIRNDWDRLEQRLETGLRCIRCKKPYFPLFKNVTTEQLCPNCNGALRPGSLWYRVLPKRA